MQFKDETVEYIEIFKKGIATYINSKLPEKENDMKGDFLRMTFLDEELDSAVVFGAAQSTYFHFEDEKFAGKNIAFGDTIGISFNGGKIEDIIIMGRAKGTYYGESGGKKKELTSEDSEEMDK